jgi:hypothetical protein
MAGSTGPGEQILQLVDAIRRRVAAGELDPRAAAHLLEQLGRRLRPRGRDRRRSADRRTGRDRRQPGAEPVAAERRTGRDRRGAVDRRSSAERRRSPAR